VIYPDLNFLPTQVQSLDRIGLSSPARGGGLSLSNHESLGRIAAAMSEPVSAPEHAEATVIATYSD